MTRLFIQIYLAVVIAMGAVAVVMVVLTRANDKYVMAEIQASMTWLNERIAATEPDSEARRQVVGELHRLVGPTVAVVPVSALDLSQVDAGRLARGEMVFTDSRQAHYAYLQLPGEDRAVEWQVHERANPLALIMNVPSHLATSHEQRQRYHIEAENVALSDLDGLDALQRARLRWRPVTVAEGLSGMATYRIDGTGEDVVRVPSSAGFNISIDWIAPFLSFSASALAILITVYPLHRKLAHLSRVAERLGNGELSARARLPGRGPIQDLAERFNHMAGRVETLIESNEELLRAVAHELRTPIARIMFASHLARRAEDPDKRTELFDKMDRAAGDLDHLTGELLAFCRLTDSAPDLVLEDITPAILIASVEARVTDPAVTVLAAPDASHPLSVSSRHVLRALDNLIANARRYAATRVEVGYRVACTRRHQPDGPSDVHPGTHPSRCRVQLYVDDDGPGVAQEARARIFEPFARAESSRTRDGGGAGLGLAIVASIASRHGGSVHVEDSPLGGARFVLDLPAGGT